ncbi:hypothetical protein J6590_012005 [Homalodisca vitripennis]|nr:hypothetical protein J6590_012005 [Homalodisca vitripennis]
MAGAAGRYGAQTGVAGRAPASLTLIARNKNCLSAAYCRYKSGEWWKLARLATGAGLSLWKLWSLWTVGLESVGSFRHCNHPLSIFTDYCRYKNGKVDAYEGRYWSWTEPLEALESVGPFRQCNHPLYIFTDYCRYKNGEVDAYEARYWSWTEPLESVRPFRHCNHPLSITTHFFIYKNKERWKLAKIATVAGLNLWKPWSLWGLFDTVTTRCPSSLLIVVRMKKSRHARRLLESVEVYRYRHTFRISFKINLR